MLPLTILPRIPPLAAKVYLVLVSCHFQKFPQRTTLTSITLPIDEICSLAGLSSSGCKKALRQLRELKLLRCDHGRQHSPNTYHFTDPANPAPPAPSDSLHADGLRPDRLHRDPLAASDSHRGNPLAPQDPVSTPKTPKVQPGALPPNQTQRAAPTTPSTGAHAFRHFFSQLSDEEKQLALALAHARPAAREQARATGAEEARIK